MAILLCNDMTPCLILKESWNGLPNPRQVNFQNKLFQMVFIEVNVKNNKIISGSKGYVIQKHSIFWFDATAISQFMLLTVANIY